MRRYSKGSVQKWRGEWRAFVSYQENGTQHRLTKMTGVRCFPKKDDMRGKQNAEKVLRQWRDELIAQDARNANVISSDAQLYEFCLRYSESKKHLVKDSTYLGYKGELRRLLGTELGRTPLGEVTGEAILLHESRLAENGLASTSIVHHHAFLSAVFKAAVANGKIPSSPMASIRGPKRRSRPINSLTSSERDHVISLLKSRFPDELSVSVALALMTGMRRGEVCALRWTDVDFGSSTITVSSNLVKTITGGWELSSPKDPGGGDSKRSIPIGPSLSGVLKARLASMSETRRLFGMQWRQDLFVVGNPITGKPYCPDLLTRDWKSFARANVILGSQAMTPVFHDLRHTFATLAVKDRAMDIKALSKILGHKDAAMTLNIYADDLDESKRAGMDRIDSLLNI